MVSMRAFIQSCACKVDFVPCHGGRPRQQGVEEDSGGDEFRGWGGEGDGDGPATNQTEGVGGRDRALSQQGWCTGPRRGRC